ncbi:MAG: hypothetical protein KF763_04855 [Cyclobacteriaceae bacterium]|nr:hypothetical protein [Cyclobacteriaceae bacterium]
MHRTVKYELLSLEAWLATGKRPNHALSGKIKSEAVRIREALLTGALSLADELHVQRYVRTHHFGVIQLLNKVWRKAETQTETNEALVELLTTIEKNFSAHLDTEMELCVLHHQQLRQQCKETVHALTKTFANLTIDVNLQGVLVSIFHEWQHAQTITYQQQKFAMACRAELNDLFANTAEPVLEETLSRFLVSINYNTKIAFKYWQTRIKRQTSTVEAKSEKRELLISFQHDVQYITVKPAMYCHPHADSLRDQVLAFINEELNSLERSGSEAKMATENIPHNFRVRTELSVSQLACFVKTLVDTRVIVNPNVSELLRFFAQTMVSKRAEDISFDSLRAKYYNIESGTKEALRQTLQNLMKKLS